MAQDLKRVYYHVIDDVVAKMKPEFVQEGVDESVLNTIRQRWAQKLNERGIISEADGQDDASKKEEDAPANSAPARKRPHDGSGPANKQEAHHDANTRIQPPAAPQVMPRQPQQQPQQMAAGLAPQLLQGLQQQQHHPGGIQQAAAGLVQVLAQAQNMPGGIQAAMGALPRMQQQGLQALAQQRGVQMQGMPQQQQQLQGLQNLQHLQAAMQLQGMPRMQGPMQMQGVAPMSAHPAMAGVPGLPQMQVPLQQHAVQQQQMPHVQMMPGIPQMQHMPQQQQQQHQRPGGYIPQQDGSSDMPPSLEEIALAAGMSQEQLRSVMPLRIVAALDARSGAAIGGSSSSSRTQKAGVTAAAPVGRRLSRTSLAAAAESRHAKRGLHIPQVDGTGDEDEEDEEDYVGGGVDDDGGEDGDDAEEPADEEDDDEDDADIAKLDDDLDAQEEADKEDIENVGFALYEKVHRAKNRWRCNLRYGVFFINGKEYMFNKGNTDLTF